MKLITKKEFMQGINFRELLPYTTVKKLLNSNAQFIIDLSLRLKISFSISTLAVHLCNTFFHKKSFLNYNRGIVCASSLFLSCKIFDFHMKIRKLCVAYHMQDCKVRDKEGDIIDDNFISQLGDKICSTESDILQVLDFQLNFDNPYLVVDETCKKYIKEIKEIYHISRMFVLDIYRTGASLFYKFSVIGLAAVLYALTVKTGFMIPPKVWIRLSAKWKEAHPPRQGQNINEIVIDDDPPEKLKAAREKIMEEWVFREWINETGYGVKPSQLLDVMDMLSELFTKIYDLDKHPQEGGREEMQMEIPKSSNN